MAFESDQAVAASVLARPGYRAHSAPMSDEDAVGVSAFDALSVASGLDAFVLGVSAADLRRWDCEPAPGVLWFSPPLAKS